MITDDSLPATGSSNGDTDESGHQTEPMELRERVLESLQSGPGVVSIDELVDDLVDDLSASSNDPAVAYRYKVRLHHVDLPRLEDADEIVYEPTSKYVILID